MYPDQESNWWPFTLRDNAQPTEPHWSGWKVVLNFNEVWLINYLFHGLCLLDTWIVSKKSLPYPRSYRFSPMLSSRSFMVLHIIFRCMIHFELIFLWGVWGTFLDSFFYVYVQLSLHHLLKSLSFLHCIVYLFLRQRLYLCMPISGLSILFHWYVYLFFSHYHTALITLAL